MDSSSFSNLAQYLKAAADPLRLQILKVLGASSYGVLELSQIFSVKQSGMSHHLKQLANAKLVISQRQGNSIFYRRSLGQDDRYSASLFKQIDQLALSQSFSNQLAAVEQERVQAAQQFFSKHANVFKQQQDLIAEFALYQPLCVEMLSKFFKKKQCHALEIGPGQGEFLLDLSSHFQQVYALDISADLLAQAKQLCTQQQITNVSFILAELKQQTLHSLDLVVMNMVLHHIPSPQECFLQIAKSLRVGGYLLMTDLCQHDQHWAKDSCGDLWLGFDLAQLEYWSKQANLALQEQSYVAMRNGFQIQCLLFKKL